MVLAIGPSVGLTGLECRPALRGYQETVFKEILENDWNNINSLVVLPTGTGKTRIASTVIQHFIQRADKIDCIIVFLAGTIQLAEQQRRVICEDLEFDELGDVNLIHSAAIRRCERKYRFGS